MTRRLLSLVRRSDDDAQQPILLPALASTNSSISSLNDTSPDSAIDSSSNSTPTRNPNFPSLTSESGNTTYTQLLPCLELCNALERSCPPFLSLACPVPQFDAARSYGVGYIDGDGSGMDGVRSDGMGSDGSGGTWRRKGGITGTSQDRYGNVWCNGNVPGLVES